MRHYIGLDWLEFYCQESKEQSLHQSNLLAKGVKVKVRSYGTPQYKTMYSILDEKDFPVIEVRRDPYCADSGARIMADRACHLRVSNRYLYTDDWPKWFRWLISSFHVTVCGISRFDVCCDFNKFRYGYNPYKFTANYMAGRVAKMHQSNLAAYGRAGWGSHTFNSLKWGSPASMVTTKLYDKSMELAQGGNKKNYIKQQWAENNLDLSLPIWRVEYSIRPSRAEFISCERGTLAHVDLEYLSVRNNVIKLFQSLTDHYFDFRLIVATKWGEQQRKDRCPRIPLLDVPDGDIIKLVRPDTRSECDRTDLLVINRLNAIANDEQAEPNVRAAAVNMLRYYPLLRDMPAVEGFIPYWVEDTTAQ